MSSVPALHPALHPARHPARHPACQCAGAARPGHGAGRELNGRRVAYFAQWRIYSGFFPRAVDQSGAADRLTNLNYAFGNVSEDGKCFIRNEAGVGDAFADFQRAYSADES